MTVRESGQDKIEKICDLLKSQALEPAEIKSRQIIAEAEQQAQNIIHKAEKTAENILKEALQKITTEQQAAHVALNEAHKQAMESLKQDIEKKLFAPALHSMVSENANDPKALAHLIEALVEAVTREGLSADFSAVIAEKVDPSTVNKALTAQILAQLREKSVQLGSLSAGALLKLHDKHVTLDISDQALEELLNKHLRKDFRDKIFAKTV